MAQGGGGLEGGLCRGHEFGLGKDPDLRQGRQYVNLRIPSLSCFSSGSQIVTFFTTQAHMAPPFSVPRTPDSCVSRVVSSHPGREHREPTGFGPGLFGGSGTGGQALGDTATLEKRAS